MTIDRTRITYDASQDLYAVPGELIKDTSRCNLFYRDSASELWKDAHRVYHGRAHSHVTNGEINLSAQPSDVMGDILKLVTYVGDTTSDYEMDQLAKRILKSIKRT